MIGKQQENINHKAINMKIIVSFSGGKDSQACLIQAAKRYGTNKIEAVFCDTGWEHPDTYQHITDTCSQMGVKLTTLKSKYDFVSLAVYKKRFPSTNARFCTSELKMKPMIDYVLSLKVVLSFRESEQVKVPHVLQWRMNVCTSNHIFNLIRKGKKKLIGVKRFENGVQSTMLPLSAQFFVGLHRMLLTVF